MTKLSRKEKKELRVLAAQPDSRIDLADIPEIIDWSLAVKAKFYRPNFEWKHIPPRIAQVKRRKR